jgi:histone-lysine N-methyltransferase SETMAR
MENQQLFHPHDHVPEHQMVMVKDFLAKNNVTTLEHPPYTPDLAPDDFYLFPQVEGTVLL